MTHKSTNNSNSTSGKRNTLDIITGTYEPLPISQQKEKELQNTEERKRFRSNTSTGAQPWKLQETDKPPRLQRQNAVEETTHNVSPSKADTSSKDLWSDMVDQNDKEQEENRA
jgi:hypothetical protein